MHAGGFSGLESSEAAESHGGFGPNIVDDELPAIPRPTVLAARRNTTKTRVSNIAEMPTEVPTALPNPDKHVSSFSGP